MKKIAVIGSGISGLSAAWALRNTADVTLFEAEDRPGGHAHTVEINHSGSPLKVDVGFIVCNPLNYPNFMNFMSALGVETQLSDMSFSVSDPVGYEWSSNPGGLFAKRRNLFNPNFIGMLLEILRFNKLAQADVEAGTIPSDMTLGAYLTNLGMSDRFRRNYILPMGAAIWSTPEAQMDAYPALSFLNFFNNHKLIHMERPQWRTVSGGSQSYVARIVETLGDRVRLNTPVFHVDRSDDGVVLNHAHGQEQFDDVILACHAPQAKNLLGNGFDAELSALDGQQTIPNRAILHCDPSLMPKRKAAWASWNVLKGHGERVTLTYWMNRLQSIDDDKPVFVTLNPEIDPAPETVFGEYEFDHPLFNLDASRSVEEIGALNGQNGVWFAGAWLGHGFHEDGLKSGLRVALALGGTIPWEPANLGNIPYPMEEQTTAPDLALMAAAQ